MFAGPDRPDFGASSSSRPTPIRIADDPIRLFLVDGQTVVREGLRALAEQQSDFVVMGTCANASRGTAYDFTPDVVVADTELPDVQGAAAVAVLRDVFPGSALVVLTLVDQPTRVHQVLKAGVDGYMLKSVPAGEFFYGLRAVAHGEPYLQPSLGVELARSRAAPAEVAAQSATLTAKEHEVLRLLALGFTNREISEQRNVSLRTIEAQRAGVLQKLGIRTRAELVQYARALGIADETD